MQGKVFKKKISAETIEKWLADAAMPEKASEPIPPEGHALARKAKRELRLTGMTTVICPRCGTKPVVTETERGERTIVSCKCGWIFDGEINL